MSYRNMSYRNSSSDSFGEAIVWLALFVLIFLISAACSLPPEATTAHVRGTVSDTYVKRSGDSGDKFFIVIDHDGVSEVFENRDAPLHGKFNSSDVQQDVRKVRESGKQACATVNGKRWEIFSWYRNVLTIRAC
jgi:hypothetical protein